MLDAMRFLRLAQSLYDIVYFLGREQETAHNLAGNIMDIISQTARPYTRSCLHTTVP